METMYNDTEDIQDTETRSNGSRVFNEPYSDDAVERLRQMIYTYYRQHRRKFYAILVDGEIVVDKTSDGRKFSAFRDFINDHTRTVEVRMYYGSSPNCNRHVFHKPHTMAGIPRQDQPDVEQEVQKALEKQRQEFEMKRLKKQLKKKEKKILELEEELASKETGLEQLTGLTKVISDGIGMVTGKDTAQPVSGAPEQDAEVTIEPEQQDESKAIYDALVNEIGMEKIKETLGLMQLLASHPELKEIVNRELSRKEQEDE